MEILIPGDAHVERITVTVRRSVDGASGWTTAEMQAEADITNQGCWDDQARRLSEQLKRLVEERLEAQRVRRRTPAARSTLRSPATAARQWLPINQSLHHARNAAFVHAQVGRNQARTLRVHRDVCPLQPSRQFIGEQYAITAGQWPRPTAQRWAAPRR